jgi:thiosulfate dehydrogenase [quinone] large subunit
METIKNTRRTNRAVVTIEDPPFERALFGDVRWAWIWLILRLYAGYQWLSAGWSKLHTATWTGNQAGVALSGFVNGALTKATGAHPDVQGWYASFLQNLVLNHAS